jgi:MFS family permease
LVISLLVCAALLLTSFVLSQLRRRRAATLLMFPLLAIALVFGLRAGLTSGWISIETLALFGVALIALVGIPLGRRGAEEPLLHLELFRDRTFSSSMVLSFLIVTVLFGSMLLIPLYLQEVHGFNALETGLMLLPQAATAAIAMPLGGILTDRIGPRPVVLFGLVLLAIGGVLLAQIHADSPIIIVVGALLLRGFAMGFTMMPSMAAAMARVPVHLTSRASSITNSLQRIGSSIGIAVLVTILVAQFAPAAAQTSCNPPPNVVAAASTAAHHPVTAAALCNQLQTTISHASFQGGASASIGDPATIPAVATFTKGYVNNVLSDAFDRVFAFTAILTVMGILPALFLRPPEKRRQQSTAAA